MKKLVIIITVSFLSTLIDCSNALVFSDEKFLGIVQSVVGNQEELKKMIESEENFNNTLESYQKNQNKYLINLGQILGQNYSPEQVKIWTKLQIIAEKEKQGMRLSSSEQILADLDDGKIKSA